jgi:hypothetical protein
MVDFERHYEIGVKVRGREICGVRNYWAVVVVGGGGGGGGRG